MRRYQADKKYSAHEFSMHNTNNNKTPTTASIVCRKLLFLGTLSPKYSNELF